MKNIVKISIAIILLTSGELSAQVSHFSQFYSTPTTIAPSFTGMTGGGTRLSLNYRDQWPKIPGVFTTFAIALDHDFTRANSGIGIFVFRDQAGSGKLGSTDLGALYSYKIKMAENRGYKKGEWFMRPGIYFRYTNRSIVFEELTFGDQYSLLPDGTIQFMKGKTIEATPLKKKGYIDFASSLIAYNELYWGGFTVDHLLEPDQSLTGSSATIPVKLSIFGGAKLLLVQKKRRSQYGVEPESVTFTMHYRLQGKYDQLDLGAYWSQDPFTLGAWFRGIPVFDADNRKYGSIDAIIVLVGLKVSESIKIGYSYDITISKLLGHTGGSHEVSLVYGFNKNLNEKRRRGIIPCPSF